MAESLEALLERAAAGVTVDPDHVATVVGERLRHAEPVSRNGWRRPLAAVAVAAAIIAVVVAVVPSTRHAVADFLGIGAVRVSDAPATGGPYTGLDLGPAVTLDE